MVPTYPTSLLARQLSLLQERFSEKHPYSWLVWEPGAWGGNAGSLAETMNDVPPMEAEGPHPTAGDPLCFELATERPMLYLGRAKESDIYVPDATVSRRHLVFRWEGSWAIQSWHRHGSPKTFINGNPLQPLTWFRLSPSDKVRLGAAEFTFLEPLGLFERVESQAPPGSPIES